jgi:hypothetical protein
MVLKSIGVLSCGKLLGAMYALIGLIVGGIFALMSLVGMALPAPQGGEVSSLPFLFLGAAAVVVMPLVYGVMGFVAGLITAAIYNLLAGLIGGLELELEAARHDPGFRT